MASRTELNKVRNRHLRPSKAEDLIKEADQRLNAFKTRFTSVTNEYIALHAAMDASGQFNAPLMNEMVANIAELNTINTTLATLDLSL